MPKTLSVSLSRFRALQKFRACCIPQDLVPCFSNQLRAKAFTSRTCRSFGGPLPHQQADKTQSSPETINLLKIHISIISSTQYYSHFRELILHFRANSSRVTQRCAEVLHLSTSMAYQTLIVALSGRINQIYEIGDFFLLSHTIIALRYKALPPRVYLHPHIICFVEFCIFAKFSLFWSF